MRQSVQNVEGLHLESRNHTDLLSQTGPRSQLMSFGTGMHYDDPLLLEQSTRAYICTYFNALGRRASNLTYSSHVVHIISRNCLYSLLISSLLSTPTFNPIRVPLARLPLAMLRYVSQQNHDSDNSQERKAQHDTERLDERGSYTRADFASARLIVGIFGK